MMPWSWPWGVIPIQDKEYKELTEKAEKSDEYYRAMREFQERNSNQAHMIRDLKKKLEAVKNWHEDVKMDPDDRYRLEKILEANDHSETS